MRKIAIHSVPRSGSSWVGQIFNSSPSVNFKFQPIFSYAFKDYLTESSSVKEINTFFKSIKESNDSFLLQQDKVESGVYPKFKKNKKVTHVVYKEVRYHNILENMMAIDPDVIVVGIVRNPYAVISSFLKSPREFRKDLGWNELDEWRCAKNKNMDKPEEFYGYEKWKEVVFLFQRLKKLYPSRFYYVKYEDLLTSTRTEVEKIFSFCDIEVTSQTNSFLMQSSTINNDDTYSVYKKKNRDDAWKGSLNPIIIEAISKDLADFKLDDFMI